MRPFDYFLDKKEVLKVTPNKIEAESIKEDALHRFDYFSKQTPNNENSKFIFENLYESVREILDSILLKKGYKSYSHQAPIVFAKDNNLISEREAIILDRLRDLRNKSKYYGKKLDLELTHNSIKEAKEIFNKIREI